MRNTARSFLTVAAISVFLACPMSASATTYEDSFEDCRYPKTLDMLLMRPFGLAAFTFGTAAFIPVGAIVLVTSPSDVGTAFRNFVVAPARFTFRRSVGECPTTEF